MKSCCCQLIRSPIFLGILFNVDAMEVLLRIEVPLERVLVLGIFASVINIASKINVYERTSNVANRRAEST